MKTSHPRALASQTLKSAPKQRHKRRLGVYPPNSSILAANQISAAARMTGLVAVGGVLAVDSALTIANRIKARRICAERQARIAKAKNKFVAKVQEIAAADTWNGAAYAAAVSEFSKARNDETTEWNVNRARIVHSKARERRESAWALWIEEFSGELLQFFGGFATFADFKIPASEILRRGFESIDNSLDVRRRIKNRSISANDLAKLLPASAPGERRISRKGAPIKRMCQSSVLPPPDAKALLAGWDATRGHGKVAEKIKLGSMLLDAEASVDSSLIRDHNGEIVGRNPGLKGWLQTHCPQLIPHYGSLMRFRRLAAAFREEHGLHDPIPASTLLDGNQCIRLPEAFKGRIEKARKEAKIMLESEHARTEIAFRFDLECRKKHREEIAEITRQAIRKAILLRQPKNLERTA